MSDGLFLIQDFAVILMIAGVAGWCFRRIKMSVIVGFLLTGIIIGPHTPPFALVSDLDRIQAISQLGLVFLMFAVGLRLNLERIRRLGFGVAATTFLGAFLVFQVTILVGQIAGLDRLQSMFLAAMLMVSSSAIIIKSLQESGFLHERFGQKATGITVLEDVVAIVMLAILSSLVGIDDQQQGGIGQTLWLLAGFATIMVAGGMLLLPRILRKVKTPSDADLKSIMVAGMLFLAAVMAARAGFSIALGAFLFGVAIAETSFARTIERSFSGALEMFSAVFFVSIGMLIDITLLWENLLLAVALTVFAIVSRTLAVGGASLIVGSRLREAVQTGLSVTVIGEFSFIIAQLGVMTGALPATYYPLAVGMCILTALTSPLLVRHSEALAAGVESLLPSGTKRRMTSYRETVSNISYVQQKNNLWKMTRPRAVRIGLELVLAAAIMGFSSRIHSYFVERVAESGFHVPGLNMAFWLVISLVVITIMVAAWRTIAALAMLYAEALTLDPSVHQERKRGLLEKGFKTVAFILLLFFVWMFFPVEIFTKNAFLVYLVVLAILVGLLGNHLLRWHSLFQSSLHESLKNSGSSRSHLNPQLARHNQSETDWQMDLIDVTLPDNARCANMTIAETDLRQRFGSSILEIERQGVLIHNPPPDFRLYPGDKLLVFGNEKKHSSN